jgi:hypothetical protein
MKPYSEQSVDQAVIAALKAYSLMHTSVKLTDAPNGKNKPSISDLWEAFNITHITDIIVQTRSHA